MDNCHFLKRPARPNLTRHRLAPPTNLLCAGTFAKARYNPLMRKGLLLYNPAAGRTPMKTFVPSMVGPLQAAGWQVEIAETLSGSHATSVARQAAAEEYDAVFAIGGDGTVGQVANGLINSDTALACAPGRDDERLGHGTGPAHLRLALCARVPWRENAAPAGRCACP